MKKLMRTSCVALLAVASMTTVASAMTCSVERTDQNGTTTYVSKAPKNFVDVITADLILKANRDYAGKNIVKQAELPEAIITCFDENAVPKTIQKLTIHATNPATGTDCPLSNGWAGETYNRQVCDFDFRAVISLP